MQRDETLSPEDLERPDWNSLKNNYNKHDVGEAYFVGRMHQIGLQVEHWGIDMRDEDTDLIFDNKMDLRLWEPLDGQSYPPTPRGSVPEDGFLEQPTEEYLKLLDAADSAGVDNPRDALDIETESWQLRGVADVKTKTNERWFPVLNIRHLVHYCEWADHFDVPVFLFFTMVDMNAETVGKKNALVPLDGDSIDNLDAYVDHFDRDTDYSTDVWDIEDNDLTGRAFRAPDGNPVVSIAEEYQHDFDWFVEGVL